MNSADHWNDARKEFPPVDKEVILDVRNFGYFIGSMCEKEGCYHYKTLSMEQSQLTDVIRWRYLDASLDN